jgi:hypothetical protein
MVALLVVVPATASHADGPDTSDTTAPEFVGPLTATNTTFRVGDPESSAERGTHLRYTLTQEASVTFTVERKTAGRREGGTCRRTTARNRKGAPCTIWVPQGSPVVAAVEGANSTPFSGKIGRKALKPGSYRVRAVATDAVGNESAEKRVKLKIVKR